jgi:hypothetical protein
VAAGTTRAPQFTPGGCKWTNSDMKSFMKRCITIDESMPPFVRGVGTTVILVATIVSLATARHPGTPPAALRLPLARPTPAAVPKPANAPVLDSDIARELAALRGEVADDSLLEEVFENPWFEISGILGTTLIAASFFLEWSIRRRKLAAKPAD